MVEFLDSKNLNGALKMNGKELDGRQVKIEIRADNRGNKSM